MAYIMYFDLVLICVELKATFEPYISSKNKNQVQGDT